MGVTAGEFSSDPHRGPQKGKNFEKALFPVLKMVLPWLYTSIYETINGIS